MSVPSVIAFREASGDPSLKISSAVGTSLFVIVLVSVSGVASHVLGGNQIRLDVASLFMLGGFVGMWLGGKVARRLNGATLQKTFAIAVVLVAAFVIFKSLAL